MRLKYMSSHKIVGNLLATFKQRMFAMQMLCLLLLLSSVCISLGDVHVETDNFEQKWSTVCESGESIVPFEKYNELAKELCEKRVELERFRLLLDSLKVQNELKDENRERENTILRDNCDLRINLASQNATFCSQKLDDCDKNMKLAEAKASNCSQAVTGMTKKEDLTELHTGYYYISDESDKANWFIASNLCKTFGLELVSIENKEENDALIKVLNGSQYYWISGTDQGSEGQFYWFSTGQLIHFYRNFDVGQPDNVRNEEHCLHYWKVVQKWNDAPCNMAMRYICELKHT